MESLQQRGWYRKLCYIFKLIKSKSSKYLFNNIPAVRSTYKTRNIDSIPQFNVRHTFFGNPYFPSIVTEWNNLDKSVRNSESFSIFKKNILQFIRPSPNSIFNCHNPKGVKLLTRLRLGLSHLRDHKFKHSFQDSLNPICNCGTDVETTTHYRLHCPLFSDESLILINNILNLNDSRFSEVLLFGNSSFNNTKNTSILNTTIEYIVSSKRFEVPLYAWLSYLPLYYFYSFFSFFKFSYFHCAISHYR